MPAHDAPSLQEFPDQVLLMIRSYMHSLQEHVTFSLLCRATFKLYETQFWRFACMSSGWGIMSLSSEKKKKLLEDSADPALRNAVEWPWAGMARVVVADAPHFSKSPRPYARLELEETIFEERMERGLWKAMPQKYLEEHDDIPVVLGDKDLVKIHYTDRKGGFRFKPRISYDSKRAQSYYNELFDYPYLVNRFMTIPPVKSLIIDDGLNAAQVNALETKYKEFLANHRSRADNAGVDNSESGAVPGASPPRDAKERVYNKHGVTVGDVYSTLSKHKKQYTDDELLELIEWEHGALDAQFDFKGFTCVSDRTLVALWKYWTPQWWR
ncbi:hypothetical protein P389DRAFT_171686 [Cystobasidium minutum MCA 4210]|uniref:uncharacterized protein n=1 Tax=Cystobasidium minutum MCA 4210 TaxID=1397322 RepID=UPI0034CE0A48|eukprot:jgi/Rhomi1/171686/fgenesh1_kg.4_\